MMRKSIVKRIVFLLVGLIFSSSAEALSIYIPQPKEDEIRISKNEYVLLHLAALGYKNEPKALVRFLKGHEVKGLVGIEVTDDSKSPKAVPVEFDLVGPMLSEAYIWQGNFRVRKFFSSSGHFWISEEVYRAQCLLNELGYSVGKPNGENSDVYKKAVTEFSRNHDFNSVDFNQVLEKLEYEADLAKGKLSTLFIRIPRRQSGPWTYPEIEPIVKKEYLAGLYLAGLGYSIGLVKTSFSEEGQVIRVFQLEEKLKVFQKENPLVDQTNGQLTDQALRDLKMIFYKKYTESI